MTADFLCIHNKPQGVIKKMKFKACEVRETAAY
jgi:hypothetical protein